ncbi:MAG: amphi-Trp domain-containing protein [Candidatus Eisenbacteria bacterium]|nr:amphi-Trp domain-containing protein [Candidatus Eisenbacteria bacterium]
MRHGGGSPYTPSVGSRGPRRIGPRPATKRGDAGDQQRLSLREDLERGRRLRFHGDCLADRRNHSNSYWEGDMDERERTEELELNEETGSSEKEKKKVKFENTMPMEEAVSYFEAIVAGMKKGTITLKQDQISLNLNPPPYVQVEVKASSKKNSEKISFEISWSLPESSGLSISSE